MPLFDRARNLIAELNARHIGTRPLVFVCHSLGGLVVKEALRVAGNYSKTDVALLSENCRGIVFLSTPHVGADIATFAARFRILLPSASIKDLRAHAPELRNLDSWYRQALSQGLKVATLVFYETQSVKSVRIVDEDSCDPHIPDVMPIAVDANHVTICKPKSPERDAVALTVEQFIRRWIEILKDDDDAAEKRDAVRFKKYAVVFSRPAFQYSCITEGALYELEDALENVTGAIGTGSVYSRKSELMATDDPSSLFESASFKGKLETIRESVLVCRNSWRPMTIKHVAGDGSESPYRA